MDLAYGDVLKGVRKMPKRSLEEGPRSRRDEALSVLFWIFCPIYLTLLLSLAVTVKLLPGFFWTVLLSILMGGATMGLKVTGRGGKSLVRLGLVASLLSMVWLVVRTLGTSEALSDWLIVPIVSCPLSVIAILAFKAGAALSRSAHRMMQAVKELRTTPADIRKHPSLVDAFLL